MVVSTGDGASAPSPFFMVGEPARCKMMVRTYWIRAIFFMAVPLVFSLSFGEEIRKEYYPDGSIKSELRYENGLLEGISRRYDDEGNLREIEYHKGKRHGMSRFYYGSTPERIHKEIMFEDDTAQGPFREYYPDGALKTEQYRVDGKPEGESRQYYKNGALFVIKNYKNGKIDGTLKMYYETGELMKKASFKNGIMDGLTTVFYKSSNIKEKLVYKNGRCIKRRCFSEQGTTTTCTE